MKPVAASGGSRADYKLCAHEHQRARLSHHRAPCLDEITDPRPSSSSETLLPPVTFHKLRASLGGGVMVSPVLWTQGLCNSLTKKSRAEVGARQDTNLYFDPNFAELLEIWGNDSVWPEIRVLLGQRSGKVLDLACGTGRTFDFLKDFERLHYYGCDISEPLIDRAANRGIPRDQLKVTDATRLDYADREFDYVFSIGSLEHFTVEGLASAISECRRVYRGVNFHQVPVSKSGFDEGWITPYQAYWNNSEQWWIEQFRRSFGDQVWSMTSRWSDRQSRGAWFICSA